MPQTREQKLAQLERGRETRRRNLLKARIAATAPEPLAAEPVNVFDPEEVEDFGPQEIVPGGEIEGPESSPVVEPLTEFDRFVLSIPESDRELLSEADLRVIYAEAEKQAKEEKRARARKAAAARALHVAKVAEGMLPVATIDDIEWRRRMDEPVRFTVDLPDMGDIGLRIDQRLYLHGHSYTVTRAEFDSMRSTAYMAQQAELLFEGKDKRAWIRRRAQGSVNGFIGEA